ncbi:MAG: hypothetical protein WKF84_05745 [Pyrinomonadaceae bacterium]
MSPNLGDGTPLISKPVPGVVKTLPRPAKVVIGIGNVVAGAAAPPPSQLISRRPSACEPGVAPLLAPPSCVRKASTLD